MADLTALAQEIDALLTSRVLIYGSLPADARDLDLLVRPDTAAELAARLPAAGFTRHRAGWVRLTGGSIAAVDATPVDAWHLPAAEEAALYDEAQPLPGLVNLCEPAPHHQLLVLARRLARVPGPAPTKHLARMERIRTSDPQAFAEARLRAAAWDCERQLKVLEELSGTGRAVTVREAQSARYADQRRAGRTPAEAVARAGRSWLPRRRRGAVVALSGLDGAGKSTQAKMLCAALEALGHDAVTEWERVTYDPGLDRITAPVRRLLMLRHQLRRKPSASPSPAPPAGALPAGALPEDRQAARALRDSSPLLAQAWVTLVTVRHAWSVRRATLAHLRRGRIVVRDRYVLDAVVQLDEQYGDQVDLRLQRWLVRRLPPRAVAAYFLDVPAEEAYRRKPDEHTPAQLASHRSRYLAAAAQLGVHTLDGSRPASVISEQLVREVAAKLEA